MRGFAEVTVEGRPFYVRPEEVTAVGTGWNEIQPTEEEITEAHEAGREIGTRRVQVTLMTVNGGLTVPVEETVEKVLSVLGESVGPVQIEV